MNSQKIAILGMGCISAAGKNIAETLQTFEKEHANAGRITLFETELDKPVFEVRDYVQKHKNRTMSLLLSAVEEASKDCAGDIFDCNKRVGVCIGTTVSSQLNNIEFYRNYREKGEASIESVDEYLSGNLAEAVARIYNFKGPRCVVVNACSSGADAIGVALSWLENGLCDIAIAGGADELNKVPLSGFNSLGIMSEKLCTPFDENRQGLNLGEGAGIMILENYKVCSNKKEKPNLFVSGYGSASDAYHLTAPHPNGEGLEMAMREALTRSEINAQGISFVNAHGTATIENDKVEGQVLKRILGSKVKFISTKGYTGHTLGAAGVIEAVFTALALREGWVPSSLGFLKEDDSIGISPVTEKATIDGKFVMSTSLAFGGNNAAAIICKE